MSRAILVSCCCLIGLSAILNGLSLCRAYELPVTLQTEAEKQAEARIVAALAESVTWDFEETALGDIVEYLAIQLDVPVVLDDSALRDVGLDSDSSITFAVKNVTGRSALQLLLDNEDLTWIVDNEVLFITTPEVAEDNLITKIYDVHDLVTFIDDQMEEKYDFDSLIELITVTLAPTTWDEIGGPGFIDSFQATGLDVLVVSQTREVHEEIELLLKKLRAAQDEEEMEHGPRPVIERHRPRARPMVGGLLPIVG